MGKQPQVIAGRYELTSAIAVGGMGTVHRARDQQLQRDVAVKLMRPGLSGEPGFARRFALEARRTARFSHPNIVAVHDYGTDDGNQFIVMELVAGGNLAQLIARHGKLSPQRSVRIAAEVAAALQVAHRHGIVHRDVKPANILVTAEGTVKLTDLGIAQAADDAHITTTGDALGTADYLSPEQVEGKDAGPPTDIYALGIVLFEMLTGRRPFPGQSASAVALSRLAADPPDPRSKAPELPPSLAAIVLRCLARDPAKRYRSARGLGIALRRWLSRQAMPTDTSVPTERHAVAADAKPTPVSVLGPAAPATRRGKDRDMRWLLPLVLLLFVAAGFAGQRLLASFAGGPESDVLTGALQSPTPVSAATSSSEMGIVVPPKPVTPSTASPEPATPAPTSVPTLPPATPQPATPAPTSVPTLPPATPQPPTPASGPTAPPVVAAMAASPSQAVARFYRLVADGSFDRAYALWSGRMKSAYPRTENLDQRFDDTARITIHRLDLLRRDLAYAVVGVEFTELYENGSSRRFDGSWELVRLDGRWLLDVPYF